MTRDAEMQDILRSRCSALGTSFVNQGGNRFLAQPSNRMLFAKTGPVAQVMGEAESLVAMHRASLAAGHKAEETLIPTVHAYGKTDDERKAFLVTDYKSLRSGLRGASQRVLGTRLAEMHAFGTSDNGMFGFDRPTHCGETEQDNTWTPSWPEFWAERRMGDLIRRSNDKELLALDKELRQKVYPLLFNKEAMKDVKPAIIHGDLWSGNSGTDDTTGQPIIFDPSSSYAHNEAELGIMKMFGGYGSDFFDAYHQVMPKAQPYYDQRMDLYEAYHHLNHFVIFGGGYRTGTVQLLKKLIDWAEGELARNGGLHGNEDGDVSSRAGPRGLRGGGGMTNKNEAPYDVAPAYEGRPFDRSSHPPPDGNAGGVAVIDRAVQDVGSPTAQTWKSCQGRANGSSTTPMPTSAQIADFFSQMVCYIWFSTGTPIHNASSPCTPSRSPVLAHQPQQSSPLTPRRHATNVTNHLMRSHGQRYPNGKKTGPSSNQAAQLPVNAHDLSRAMQTQLINTSVASSTALSFKSFANDPIMQRLQPKGRFLRFIRELLNTTQLSTSVITLALIYVHRLKSLHPQLQGREGSEYRVGISALMMANKILDDNTYLNKTWSEISGMPLVEISKMEVEFWLGLKMELHTSKKDYEIGLQELQVLADERVRAIYDREAILKKFAQHHHHHQQQQQQQQQQQSFLARQAQPYMAHSPLRSSLPFLHRQWNASSDCVLPANHPIPQAVHVRPQEPRRSFGGNSGMEPFYNANPMMGSLHRYPLSPDTVQRPQPAPTHISPAHTVPYTLPSSPLSQGSGVPSLAATSNEALVYPSDPEIGTPQEGNAMPMYGMDHAMHPFNPPGASAMYYTGARGTTADLSPNYDLQYSFPTFSNAPAHDAHRHAPVPPPTASSQHPSTLMGLKRDFERANIGSASPNDGSNSKRFAFDPFEYGDKRKHHRFPSSGYQSPSESAALRHRLSSSTSPYSTTVGEQQQVSISPISAIPFAVAQGSPAYTAPFSRPQSWVETPSSALNVSSSRMAPQPDYHSVFSSALTPTALAAPLDVSQSSWSMSRSKAPLQYYSLAAGEPHGTLATYVPPTMHHSFVHHPGHLRSWTNVVPPSDNESLSRFSTPASRFNAPMVGYPLFSSNTFDLPYQSGNINVPTNNDVLQLSSTQTPQVQTDTIAQSHRVGQHFAGVGGFSATPFGDLRSSKDAPQQQKQAPPFYFDPHGWPLSTASNTSTFLFPYHLVPEMATTPTH